MLGTYRQRSKSRCLLFVTLYIEAEDAAAQEKKKENK